MRTRRTFVIPVFVLGLVISAGAAWAQGKTVKDQIAGTWTVVSYSAIAGDGSKKPIFSANPKGTLILNANGRYAMILVDPDRPKKWTGKSRDSATVEELASAARELGCTIWGVVC